MPPFLFLAALATGQPAACPPHPNRDYVEWPDLEFVQCFPAPRSDLRVRSQGGRLVLERGSARYALGQVEGGHVYWNPAGTGLVFTDNEGSGQSSYLYFVDARARTPTRSAVMGNVAVDLFKRRFRCVGPSTYVYVWVDGWNADGRLRLVVQEGPHSEGCRTYGNTVGMVVEPKPARVIRVLTDSEMRGEWCTVSQRVRFGYCYDETLVASLKRPGRKK